MVGLCVKFELQEQGGLICKDATSFGPAFIRQTELMCFFSLLTNVVVLVKFLLGKSIVIIFTRCFLIEPAVFLVERD